METLAALLAGGEYDWHLARVLLYAGGAFSAGGFALWMGHVPHGVARLVEWWAWAWTAVCAILCVQCIFGHFLGGPAGWSEIAWIANALILCFTPVFMIWQFRRASGEGSGDA